MFIFEPAKREEDRSKKRKKNEKKRRRGREMYKHKRYNVLYGRETIVPTELGEEG